jgi:FkbM family methyltransferase
MPIPITSWLKSPRIFFLIKSAERLYIRYVWRKLMRIRGLTHPIQNTRTSTQFPLVYFGSPYGGWTFVPTENLRNSTVISAGLGEDASFDIELATHYGCRVVIIDPTPRAVEYFELLISNLGNSKIHDYSLGASQDVESYDLSNVTRDQLYLIPKALWNTKGKVRFYRPTKQSRISYSILNYRNNYSTTTNYIEVECDTITSLLSELNIRFSDIPLVKFDIEGAEIEVLHDMFENDLLPQQILVEFDELNKPSLKGLERVDRAHRLLRDRGYDLIHTDGQADFLYLRKY